MKFDAHPEWRSFLQKWQEDNPALAFAVPGLLKRDRGLKHSVEPAWRSLCRSLEKQYEREI